MKRTILSAALIALAGPLVAQTDDPLIYCQYDTEGFFTYEAIADVSEPNQPDILYTSDDDQYFFVYTYDDCAINISVEGQ
jgi:hypothetical protein